MTLRIYMPGDAGALSLGAESVAKAVTAEAARRGLEIQLVRNGSRGAYWLEPLLEVERDGRRLAFGPVQPRDVPALFDADFGKHSLALGPAAEIPW